MACNSDKTVGPVLRSLGEAGRPLAAATLLFLLASPASAIWPMRPRVRVQARVVTLGDLLAPQAPSVAPPSQVLLALVLAAAPQPGMPLRWSAAQLSARLRGAGVPAADFVIPAEVEIERQAAPVPAAAVLTAASAYLHRPLAAADLEFLAPQTTARHPAVMVLRSQPDVAHGRLDLICRAQNDPQLLPFTVSVRVPAAELEQQARQRWLRAFAAPRAVSAARPALPLLVRTGHLARLTINDPGFALVTLVEPLQPGRAGDIIRVRSLATKAVLRVRVTGIDQVSSLTIALTAPPREAPNGRN